MFLEILSGKKYLKKPPRTGNYLLFIHGACHAAWCWEDNFLPYFTKKGIRTHALSLRGHGGSEITGKLNGTSLEDFALDVKRTVEMLGDRPILVGHSFGGLVVQKYLELWGTEESRAVLLAPSPPFGSLATAFRLFRRYPMVIFKVLLFRRLRFLFGTRHLVEDLLFSRRASEETVKRCEERLGEESFRLFLQSLFHPIREKRVKGKIVVAGAKEDEIFDVKTMEKTARIYGGEAIILSDLSHNMMLDPNWKSAAETVLNSVKEKKAKKKK